MSPDMAKRKVTKKEMLAALMIINCPDDPVDCKRDEGCLECKAAVRAAIVRLIRESRRGK
jgi:hypothetical protein